MQNRIHATKKLLHLNKIYTGYLTIHTPENKTVSSRKSDGIKHLQQILYFSHLSIENVFSPSPDHDIDFGAKRTTYSQRMGGNYTT